MVHPVYLGMFPWRPWREPSDRCHINGQKVNLALGANNVNCAYRIGWRSRLAGAEIIAEDPRSPGTDCGNHFDRKVRWHGLHFDSKAIPDGRLEISSINESDEARANR